MRISELHQIFLQERQFLSNVSPATLDWHKYSFLAFTPAVGTLDSTASGLRDGLRSRVMALVGAGRLKPASVNDYIRAMNAFLRWGHTEGHLPEFIRLEYLRSEQNLIQTLSPEHVRRLLSVRPKGWHEWRLYALVCVELDCRPTINASTSKIVLSTPSARRN